MVSKMARSSLNVHPRNVQELKACILLYRMQRNCVRCTTGEGYCTCTEAWVDIYSSKSERMVQRITKDLLDGFTKEIREAMEEYQRRANLSKKKPCSLAHSLNRMSRNINICKQVCEYPSYYLL